MVPAESHRRTLPSAGHTVRGAVAAAAAAACLLPLEAQDFSAARSFLGDDPSSSVNLQNNSLLPYRPLANPRSRTGAYNILMGPVAARFSTSTTLSYTDNAVFAEQAIDDPSDIVLTPMLNTHLEWPITDMNGLRIDIGVGYQKHFIQEQLDSLTLSPNSTIDWLVIAGNVRISLFNSTSTMSDLVQRPELVGTGSGESAAFRRIQNQTGGSASWILSRDVSLQGGYSFMLERGLTGGEAFSGLDRDTHSVNTALYRRLSPVWTVGVSGSASLQAFKSGLQNGATSYSGGLLAAWQPGRYFNVSTHVRYSITEFDQTGRVADTSQFAGLTYDISVSHRFRKNWEYGISAGSGVNTGLGSNFTEQLFANLFLIWTLNDSTTLNLNGGSTFATESGSVLTLSKEAFRIGPESFDPTVPGMVDDGGGRLYYLPPGVVDAGNGIVGIPLPGRESQVFQGGIGLNHRFNSKLSVNLTYSYSLRQSDLQLRNFTQHMVSVGLNYNF